MRMFQQHGTKALKIVAASQDSSGCTVAGNDQDHGFSHLWEGGKGNWMSSTKVQPIGFIYLLVTNWV